MVDRWTVEKAVRNSSMRPAGRHVLLTLLTWTDHDTATIPARFSPSLTELAKSTGYARSTVARWLNRTEGDGWLVRERPSVHDARRFKQRTVYRLCVPAGLQLVDTVDQGVDSDRGAEDGRQGPQAAAPPVDAGAAMPAPSSATPVGPVAVADNRPFGPPPAARRNGQGLDHRYVEGPNGACAVQGCTRSAPLHPPARRSPDPRRRQGAPR